MNQSASLERYRDGCQEAVFMKQSGGIMGGSRRQHAPRQRDHAAVSRAQITGWRWPSGLAGARHPRSRVEARCVKGLLRGHHRPG